jgi:hypothetical protein
VGIQSRVVVFTILIGLVTHPALAQTPDLVRTAGPELEAGDRVVVLTRSGERHTGRLRTLTDRSLALDTADGLVDLRSADVGRIVVRDSIANGTLIGLGAGAASGALLAYYYIALCESDDCGSEALGIALFFSGVGAGIGAGIDGLILDTVFDVLPDVPGELRPEVVGYVGGSHTRSTIALALRDKGRLSLGGAWGVRHRNGFGVELELSRTFGDASRLVPCTGLEALGDVSGCRGGGRRGLAETTVGSAKIQYFFSEGRAQPYVSGGVGIFAQTFWHSWVYRDRYPYEEVRIYEARGQWNGLAFLAGGGVRIALGRRFSLRPDVTMYAGSRWTHVRAGIGAGVGW